MNYQVEATVNDSLVRLSKQSEDRRTVLVELTKFFLLILTIF